MSSPRNRPSMFLYAHVVGDLEYSLGGPAANIRDQMVRACLLVDECLRLKEIQPATSSSNRPLLVVGAGIAGVTAALRAAAAGVETVLVGATSETFSRQRNARRWIDPTLYDWPSPHWSKGAMPFEPAPHPAGAQLMGWIAGTAATVLERWDETLGPELKKANEHPSIGGRLRFLPSLLIEYRSLKRRLGKYIDVEDYGGAAVGPDVPRQFGMVLWALGFHPERNSVKASSFRSLSYWNDDGLESIDTPSPRRVLIAGAGDAGLQDYLRAITGAPSAKSLADECKLPDWLAPAVAAVEEPCEREQLWRRTREHACGIALRAGYDKIVDQLWGDGKVRVALAGVVKPKRERREVRLIHSCQHFGFGRSYPLNRLLTLLVARYLQEVDNLESVHSGLALVDVNPAGGHDCGVLGSVQCARRKHLVRVGALVCGGGLAVADPQPAWTKEPFDLVLLRYGLDQNLESMPDKELVKDLLARASRWERLPLPLDLPPP